ncbi:MAG: tetratricopeptide repeat protein [Desulfuromonadales bacterium]|nr:tetratricopeptide repeat protein [Desulfuromonadales bacterium]
MKIQPLLVVSLCLLLFGCTVPPQPHPESINTKAYRSEYADPNAKALFAYAQFRLLAAEGRWKAAVAALKRAVAFDQKTDYLRMNLAKGLLHLEQSEESIAILRNILNKSPDNVDGHELLGDLLSYQKQDEAAVHHYRLALQLAPDSEMLPMRLAMALGRLRQIDEAIAVLERLVKQQPEARLAQLSLARFYQENKQPKEAEAVYRVLLERQPDQQQAILEYGRLLEQQNLVAEAFQLYRKGIRRNPRAVAVRQQLAMLYLQQNRYLEALEQLAAIRQQFPDNLQVIGRIGLIQLELEHWEQAENDFHELLRHGENQGRNRYYLGMALLGQKKYTEAVEVMSPVSESSPIFAETVMQLTYIYKQTGQVDQAIVALRKVLQQGIHHPEIYYYLTSFLGDQDDLTGAAEVVLEGIERFPHDIELHYQQAVLYEKRGDRQKALEVMQNILSLDADHPEALNFIAYHQAETGEGLELALTRVQKALSAKKSGYIIDTLGWIYFKMGRYDESREQLEEASSLLPEDPVILEHLGDLYRALTLWQKAAEAYRKALEVDPQAEGVIEKLQALPSGGAQ